MPAKQPVLTASHRQLLNDLGERLRLARRGRTFGVEFTCRAAGISRMTLYRAERGHPAVALGTLVRILSVFNLETDLQSLVRIDDLTRMILDDSGSPRRRKLALDFDD